MYVFTWEVTCRLQRCWIQSPYRLLGAHLPWWKKWSYVCLLFVSSRKPSLDTFATRKCLLLFCATCNWIKQPYEMEWQVLLYFFVNVRAPLHCQASASSSMAWPMSGESHSTLKPVTATLLDAWKRLIITTCNNNNLHLYSANLYMNIFGCALQYCYIKFMSNVTKRTKLWKTTIQAIKNY